jgi:hypothetical protein
MPRCLEGTSVGLRERQTSELDPTQARRERIPADRPRVCDSDARRARAVVPPSRQPRRDPDKLASAPMSPLSCSCCCAGRSVRSDRAILAALARALSGIERIGNFAVPVVEIDDRKQPLRAVRDRAVGGPQESCERPRGPAMRSPSGPPNVSFPPRVPLDDGPFPPRRHRCPISSCARQPRKSRWESPRLRREPTCAHQ